MSTTRQPVVAGIASAVTETAVLRAAAAEAVLRERPLRLVAAYAPSAAQVRAACRGARVDVAVASGTLADAVTAESGAAHLVVTGGPLGHAVAAHVRCPLLVVPPGRAGVGGGPVLVAVDAAVPGFDPVLEFGFEAAAARGVPLRAAFVWTAAGVAVLDSFAPGAILARHAESDRLLAEALAGWCGKYPDVAVRREEVHGASVAGALIRMSASAGLVVIGSRPRPAGGGPWARRAVGEVTHALLARAWCPVALVPVRVQGPRPVGRFGPDRGVPVDATVEPDR